MRQCFGWWPTRSLHKTGEIPPGSVGVARDSDADSKRQNVHDQDDATAATVRGHEL
jgi:hypothetical protein